MEKDLCEVSKFLPPHKLMEENWNVGRRMDSIGLLDMLGFEFLPLGLDLQTVKMLSNKDAKRNSFDKVKLDALWKRIQLIKNGKKPEALNREQIRSDLYEEVKHCENKEQLAETLKRMNKHNDMDEKKLVEPTTSIKEHHLKSASLLSNRNSVAPKKSPIVAKLPFTPFKIPDRPKIPLSHKKSEVLQSARKKSNVTTIENKAIERREGRRKSKENARVITLSRTKAASIRSDERPVSTKPFRLPVSIIVPKKGQQLRNPLEEERANKEEEVEMLNKRNAKFDLEMPMMALLNVHDLMCEFKCSNLFKRDPPVPGMYQQIKRPLNLHLIKLMIKPRRSSAPDNESLEQIKTLGQYREMFHTMLANVIMFLPKSDDNLNYVASCEFMRYADSVFEKMSSYSRFHPLAGGSNSASASSKSSSAELKDVIVQNTPSYVNERTLEQMVTSQGFRPMSVTVDRKFTPMGTQQVDAWISFDGQTTAQAWIMINQVCYLAFYECVTLTDSPVGTL